MDFWISRGFLDFTISDLFLSSMSHYRPIPANLSNEASVIACLRRLSLSSHQNYVAQTLAGRPQPSHYCCRLWLVVYITPNTAMRCEPRT